MKCENCGEALKPKTFKNGRVETEGQMSNRKTCDDECQRGLMAKRQLEIADNKRLTDEALTNFLRMQL